MPYTVLLTTRAKSTLRAGHHTMWFLKCSRNYASSWGIRTQSGRFIALGIGSQLVRTNSGGPRMIVAGLGIGRPGRR